MTKLRIKYQAAATAAEFHADNSFVRGIRGPVGSGKSVACVMELFKRAHEQEPDATGVRRTRFACVRNTFPELKSTVIKTVEQWLPEAVFKIKYDSPISGKLRLPLPDGTRIESEWLFMALDKPKDSGKLLSLELTAGWINEAKEIDKAIVDGLTQRVARFPSMKDGGATWSGVIMDTNSPDSDHWWHYFEREDTPRGWKFFTQPGALLKRDGQYYPNPKAENIENHSKGYDYYLDQVGGKSENWIRAFILNQFAMVEDGLPIFRDHYNEQLHLSEYNFCALPDVPICLGFDFGLTPACIVGQVTPLGQLRILDEIIAERMGFEGFLKEAVLPLLKQKYKGHHIIAGGDPAGIAKGDTNELSVYDIAEEQGLEIEPIGDNTIDPRLESVRWWLSRLAGKGQPAMVLSKRCVQLNKGFVGGYQYKRVQVSGEARYKNIPDKNKYSHPMDALQYLCMMVKPDYSPQKSQAINTTATIPVACSVTGY